jgi:hypothetical protein
MIIQPLIRYSVCQIPERKNRGTMGQYSSYSWISRVRMIQLYGKYRAFADIVTCNCLLSAPGRNCMTHRQALQDFPDMSQVSLHKKNKINIPFLQGDRKVKQPIPDTCSVCQKINYTAIRKQKTMFYINKRHMG